MRRWIASIALLFCLLCPVSAEDDLPPVYGADDGAETGDDGLPPVYGEADAGESTQQTGDGDADGEFSLEALFGEGLEFLGELDLWGRYYATDDDELGVLPGVIDHGDRFSLLFEEDVDVPYRLECFSVENPSNDRGKIEYRRRWEGFIVLRRLLVIGASVLVYYSQSLVHKGDEIRLLLQLILVLGFEVDETTTGDDVLRLYPVEHITGYVEPALITISEGKGFSGTLTDDFINRLHDQIFHEVVYLHS